MFQRLKSRTNRWALAFGMLSVVEINFHLLQDILGEWYGISFMVVMVIMVILREVTTKPVTEK